MRQYLKAQQIQAFNQITLDELIDSATMRNLKAREDHPEIRLYSIGHEGEANLHLPGIGTKTFTWIQAAVKAIGEKLNIGTAVFNRHDPTTNSHEGRIQIGEVVGKAMKQIGDRLNTLAAIYIYPQFKSRPLEVASVEAQIEFNHDDVQAWPTEVKDVSGIALSSAGIDTPGFPGATLLGAVQAYVQAFGGGIGDNKMNKSEALAAVKELGLTPTQVFNIEDIMADSTVSSKVKEAKTTLQSSADRWKESVDKSREKIAELENQNAEKDKTIKQHTVQSKTGTVLDEVLADPESKITDMAKTFIKRNYKSFSTVADNDVALKEDVGKFIKEQLVEFNENAKLFGVKTDTVDDKKTFTLPPNMTVGGQRQGQTPRENEVLMGDEALEAEMDPAQNPLIAGGAAAKEALKT